MIMGVDMAGHPRPMSVVFSFFFFFSPPYCIMVRVCLSTCRRVVFLCCFHVCMLYAMVPVCVFAGVVVFV